MGENKKIKVLYNGKNIDKILDKLVNLEEVNKDFKIYNNKNVSSFYYKYKINLIFMTIEFINISKIDNSILEYVIKEEFKNKNELLVLVNLNDDFSLKLNENSYIKTNLSNELLERLEYVDSKILLNYIIKDYFKNLYIENDALKYNIYLTEKINIKDLGIGIMQVLKEYKKLDIQKEIHLNIISGENLYLDTLSLISDPILEYTGEGSKVTINNVIQENLKDEFIINILGAF
ncbi:hypothetical protein BH721_14345 [Clostridium baratii]|uniref:Uncharacterized protein n=1 Tax=Clostridium baratii TaxID=1561 RepID=A0A174U4P1_9CLOT|nr:hypothetical protein [Clostridium baratii]OPF50372.1 hypothetical protein A1M12_08980 [Clostridium baratii]OPF53315.1 hypothetical protein BH724_04065 [Clostridium baratii]OPF54714.1 hypothetical protein BH721_14345 [Clostridium baratii]OPF61193.1 hypothetical protein BH725_14100 [Clostridium baratii]CUQ14610.1 Uncharacterised protein [Clostridium baratii]